LLLRWHAREAEAAARLSEIERMETLGRITSSFAHDLNNLLAAIGGNVALAYRRMQPEDGSRTQLSAALEGVSRGAQMAAQLLGFARQGPAELAEEDLCEQVGRMAELLRQSAQTCELRLLVPDAPLVCAVNKGEFGRSLMNLVVNARDAMPSGGTLTIATGNFDVAEWDLARPGAGLPPGPYVMLSVTDTGCGMSPEVRARILEPFFTTKPAGKGTGLGLPTVCSIVQQAGGRITVETVPGRGSAFTIYLPQARSEAEAARHWS
jgi:signal transduction histidine kinase